MKHSEATVKTKYGMELTPHQVKAYKTIKKLIERDEQRFADGSVEMHRMADTFRSYFEEI